MKNLILTVSLILASSMAHAGGGGTSAQHKRHARQVYSQIAAQVPARVVCTGEECVVSWDAGAPVFTDLTAQEDALAAQVTALNTKFKADGATAQDVVALMKLRAQLDDAKSVAP